MGESGFSKGNDPTRQAAPSRTAPAEWIVERRGDDVVLVRVPSSPRGGQKLPDAVFTFRLGDPQYDYWERELLRRSGAAVASEE